MVKPDAGHLLGRGNGKGGRCNALLSVQAHCMRYSEFENSEKVQAISLARPADVGPLGSVGAFPNFESFDIVG